MSWIPIHGPLYAPKRIARDKPLSNRKVNDSFDESTNIGDLIMRAAILVAGCFLTASLAFAGDQQTNNVAPNTAAKPVLVAYAKKPEHRAVRSAKTAAPVVQSANTDVPVRVWTVEMSCCEPQ